MNLNILDRFFRKIPKHKMSWKPVQWKPSCFMQAYERQIVAVRKFPNATKHELHNTEDIYFSKYSSS
jgi:hypothetical protein